MNIKKFSLSFLGFLQATGLFVYISLISLFLSNANTIIGPALGPKGGFLGPMAFLLLFVVSALISGLLVLAKPGFLFWEKRYKESFTLLSWTTIWAIFYLILVFAFLYSFK